VVINTGQNNIELPVAPNYKYLGIKIDRNFRGGPHLEYISKKTNYISASFFAVRQASMSNRFCYNTWQVFIRPLLDYTATYRQFIPQMDDDKYDVLYRQSVRYILFLPKNTSIELVDKIISYDYGALIYKTHAINKLKIAARMSNDPQHPNLQEKVKFGYTRIDWKRIPHDFRIAVALYHKKGTCPCGTGEDITFDHLDQVLTRLTSYDSLPTTSMEIFNSLLNLGEKEEPVYDPKYLRIISSALQFHFHVDYTIPVSMDE